MPSDAVPLSELSAALDEIHRLRTLLAYEADVLFAHTTFERFPKSRRQYAALSVARMRKAACGKSSAALAEVERRSLRASLLAAGASECLTVLQWREEQANAK